MKNSHILFVCTSCASIWKDGKREGVSGGQKLYAQLNTDWQNWNLAEHFQIQSVECMSACDRSCAVSFAATNKFTYLFGDLAKDLTNKEETLPSSLSEISAALIQCAEIYYGDENGNLAWKERPELLKKGLLAKIPPLPFSSSSNH
jgi:predicted metal-binding protein